MSYLPEWLSRAVTPESYGESVVNAVYGAGGTLSKGEPDPEFDPTDLSSPNVYVAAKGAVKSFAAEFPNTIKKYAFLAVCVLIAVAFVHGVAMRAR